MSDSKYRSIVEACQKRGLLYEDPEFPATDSSLFYSQLPPYQITWLRAPEIARLYGQEAVFVDSGFSRFDLNQGELGDCWVVAALASLTDNPEALQRVVPPDQTFDRSQGYCGAFRFRFFRFGRWVEVVIDDRLPTADGQLLYIHSAEKREFWGALAEKAYAKLFGCYESLSGGLIGDAMDDLTGGMSEAFNLNKAKADTTKSLPRYLFQAFDRNSMVGAGILDNKGPGTVTLTGKILSNGLVAGHAYTISDIRQLRLTDRQNRNTLTVLVRVRNPWGDKVEWNGAWSDRSPEWAQLTPTDRQALGLVARDDGEFWISWDDFVSNFDTLDFCHIPPDVSAESAKRWSVQGQAGVWEPGKTAGGRPACRDTHWTNPQFHVRLVDSDEDEDTLATCIVGLQQKDIRGARRQTDYLQIGFAIYPVPPRLVGRQLPREFFLSNAYVAACDFFINSRSNVKRFNLQPGNYVIVPSTFEPNQAGSFLLRVYTERESSTPPAQPAPTPAPVVPGPSPSRAQQPQDSGVPTAALDALKKASYDEAKFRQVFAQNSGIDMALDPWELQQNLPQMLAIVGRLEFSIDACKQLVSLTDVNNTGKMTFQQFNFLWNQLVWWLRLFFEADGDRNGSIDSAELQSALGKSGYKLPQHLVLSLRRRYADRDGRLDLSGFIRSMASVMSAFQLYQSAAKGQAFAKMTLDEFFAVCLTI